MKKAGILLLLLAASVSFASPNFQQLASFAINSLGIDLLARTSKPTENALISPYSIQCALAMAYAGADGSTRTVMAQVLHYPEDETGLHRSVLGTDARCWINSAPWCWDCAGPSP